jgi:hypothetical protein
MKPSQAFGVVVRSLGLVAWVVAAFYACSTALALIWPNYRAGIAPWWHYLLTCAMFVIIGLILVRKAEHIVAFAYRQQGSGGSDA